MDIEGVRNRWETVGEEDPLWGVLSFSEMKNGKWDPEEFFKIGDDDVVQILSEGQAIGMKVFPGRALDFGCGVGRLSLALASTFQTVTGVDIAEPMVKRARKFAAIAGVPNAEFVVNTDEHLPFDDGSFDFSLSWIVLQHQPPALALSLISELIRVTRPGGTLVFQLPADLRNKSTSKSAWKRKVMAALPNERVQQFHRLRAGKGRVDQLPMHGVRRHKVIDFVERHNAEVVAVVEDGAAGSSWRSFHYFIRPPDSTIS